MLGFPIVYFKGMRIMTFQLSGFYCRFYRRQDFSCKQRGGLILGAQFHFYIIIQGVEYGLAFRGLPI